MLASQRSPTPTVDDLESWVRDLNPRAVVTGEVPVTAAQHLAQPTPPTPTASVGGPAPPATVAGS
jgi:hypothetical protein